MPNALAKDRTRIVIAVPKTLKAKLVALAKRRQTDLSKLCNQALFTWLSDRDAEIDA